MSNKKPKRFKKVVEYNKLSQSEFGRTFIIMFFIALFITMLITALVTDNMMYFLLPTLVYFGCTILIFIIDWIYQKKEVYYEEVKG